MKKVFEALEILCGELVETDLLFIDKNGKNQELWRNSEAFKKLQDFEEKYGSPITVLQQALTELEAIKSAEPTKALECLESMKDTDIYMNRNVEPLFEFYKEELNTIKQALIQKIIWKHIHNTNVRIPLCDIVNGRTQEERFEIIEDIYYNWEEKKEKLEDKITSLENENKFLKEQKSNTERCLKIIFEKSVITLLLELAETVDEYNERIVPNNGKLTQDEFNILKEWCERGSIKQ